MPALKNQKHEQFAQMLIEGQKFGWTRGACYSRAGYKAEGQAADTNASRLLRNAQNGIAARVQEIVSAGSKRSKVTVETLMGKLDAVFDNATADKQHGAAGKAVEVQGKLTGLLRDKVEIGPPGSFDGIDTIEGVADKILSEEDPHHFLSILDALRAIVVERAADRATVIERPPSTARPNTEADRAIEMFRPRRKDGRS